MNLKFFLFISENKYFDDIDIIIGSDFNLVQDDVIVKSGHVIDLNKSLRTRCSKTKTKYAAEVWGYRACKSIETVYCKYLRKA